MPGTNREVIVAVYAMQQTSRIKVSNNNFY